MRIPPELTPLEAAAGCPLGGRGRPAPQLGGADCQPIDALVAAIERTLPSGPPAVAFSGGRDSSLLLAATALVCRSAQLPPPLPITLCMSQTLVETDEGEWQERVMEHLGIPRWERVQIDDELDFVGSYARRQLQRGELIFPANAHSVLPLLDVAGDRPLIVGLGGDELLSSQQWRTTHDLLGGRRGPRPRDLLRLAVGALPRSVRGMTRPTAAEDIEQMQWLRPAARRRLARLAVQGFEEPVRFATAVRHVSARRDVILPLHAMQRLARDRGQSVHAPLLDAGFVGALARAGGSGGWGGRTATMNALAADLLPADVLGRSGKAYFNRVFFGEHSRAFAAAWSGEGLDDTLVDPEVLRREWLSEIPDFRTSMLIQSAWLADHDRALAHAA